ncbi:MAG: hypothetical protein Q4D82_03910 [Neisseria sp.]|nr:hypothetical protein [Neisseria sp.]
MQKRDYTVLLVLFCADMYASRPSEKVHSLFHIPLKLFFRRPFQKICL